MKLLGGPWAKIGCWAPIEPPPHSVFIVSAPCHLQVPIKYSAHNKLYYDSFLYAQRPTSTTVYAEITLPGLRFPVYQLVYGYLLK